MFRQKPEEIVILYRAEGMGFYSQTLDRCDVLLDTKWNIFASVSLHMVWYTNTSLTFMEAHNMQVSTRKSYNYFQLFFLAHIKQIII